MLRLLKQKLTEEACLRMNCQFSDAILFKDLILSCLEARKDSKKKLAISTQSVLRTPKQKKETSRFYESRTRKVQAKKISRLYYFPVI
jgi:hypothetical protein